MNLKITRSIILGFAALLFLTVAGCGNKEEEKPAGSTYYEGTMKPKPKAPGAQAN